MSIVGILGLKRSGKDTSANLLINSHGFVRYSFADPLKKAAKEIFCFTDEQLWGDDKETIDPNWGISAREVLQIMGTEMLQYDIHKHTNNLSHIGRHIWVHRFKIWYNEEIKKNPNLSVVIPDVRFQHEVDIIKTLGGVVWKVVRPSLTSLDLHPSETEMEKIIPDVLFMNDGTIDELYKKIENECFKSV